MYSIDDKVRATRPVRAGLGENGPVVCDKGATGVIIKIESHEPDGIHVRLENGSLWWFKPNQLEKVHE